MCKSTKPTGPFHLDDIIFTICGEGVKDRQRYFDFIRWYRNYGCCRIRLFNGFSGEEINCVQKEYSFNLTKENNDPKGLYGYGPWSFVLNFPSSDVETALWAKLRF